MTHIRAHFDGRVLVPDHPVDLPIGKPLDLDVTECAPGGAGPKRNGASKGADLNRFAGTLSLPEDPVEYQRRARDEWR